MKGKRFLLISHDIEPYTKQGKLAKVAHQIIQYLHKQGSETRLFIPRFAKINERKHRLHEVIRLSGVIVNIGEEEQPIVMKVATLPVSRSQVYFLDNEDYFQRKAFMYDNKGKFFEDNHERFIFFNKGVVEIMQKLGWAPDVVYCHGWMSSLIPYYIRTSLKKNPMFKKTKFIYGYDREPAFEGEIGADFSINAKYKARITKAVSAFLKEPTYNNINKIGLKYADGIVKYQPEGDEEIEDFIENTAKAPVLEYADPASVKFLENFYEFFAKIAR